MKWTQQPIPMSFSLPPGTRRFSGGDCTVLLTREPRWHLSISHPDRYPSWDEIHSARYELVPDAVTMAMLFPPKAEYVNMHGRCFHLHEIRGEELQ